MNYITNFNANNIPNGQPVIIKGMVNICRVINYWRPNQTNKHPNQQLQIINPVFEPVCLEKNPNSPDFNAAMGQAMRMIEVLKQEKTKIDESTGQVVYNWNNTLYSNDNGTSSPLIPLFHRQPNGTAVQIEWDTDLAQGVQVSIMVIPKIRGQQGQKNMAQLGKYVCVEQQNVAWYQGYGTEFIADTLGIDPTTIKPQSMTIHEEVPNNQQNTQQQGYNNQQGYDNAGQAYGNQQVGYSNNQQAYNNTQQNTQQAYGNAQQAYPNQQTYGNTQQSYGNNPQNTQQAYPNQQAYGNAGQAYGNQQVAYGNTQPNTQQVYGNQQVGYGNNQQTAYGNVQQPYTNNQPNNQSTVPLFNNNNTQPTQPQGMPYGNNQSQAQPSESFMNIPTGTELPFN